MSHNDAFDAEAPDAPWIDQEESESHEEFDNVINFCEWVKKRNAS